MLRVLLRASLLLGLAVATAGCPKPEHKDPQVTDASAPKVQPFGSTGVMAGPLYPLTVTPDPLAVRLCDLIYTVPNERKAACCGGQNQGVPAGECVRLLSASVQNKSVVIDVAAVERCETAIKSQTKDCNWVTPSQPRVPDACQAVLVGQVPEGGVCRSSLDCAGKLHCDGATPNKTGTCTSPRATGAGCGPYTDALISGVGQRDVERQKPPCAEFCALSTHTCGPLPTEGTGCFVNNNCAPGQVCASGKCTAAAPAKEGESCEAKPCDAGLRCVAAKCVALGMAGASCTSDFDCAQGGCVKANGKGTCGKKCATSLDMLEVIKSGQDAGALPLPKVPGGTGPGPMNSGRN